MSEHSDSLGLLPPRVALCSLSNMDGAEEFFNDLFRTLPDLQLYATEGTAGRLNEWIAEVDGKPRVQSINNYISPHRGTLDIVKTLDTRIFSGILADRDNPEHRAAIAEQKLMLFDMVIVNFYTQKIDIGGPALLRAAAKNVRYVTAIGAHRQYQPLISELISNNGHISYRFRKHCALMAMHIAAEYVRRCSRHIPREFA